MNKYFWRAITAKERIEAIPAITAAIGKYAILLQFQRFSDISLSLVLELPENQLGNLHEELMSLMSVEAPELPSHGLPSECILLLQVDFAKGTGELVIENPNLPE